MKRITYTLLIGLILLASCSTKKAGITNRTYHRLTSWYNTGFNGHEALLAHIEASKGVYKDNFSTTLRVEPNNPFSDEGFSLDAYTPTSPSISILDDIQNMDIQNINMQNAADRLFSSGSTSNAQGLDRVIEKNKNAIEKHSILIKGKEHNSMLADAYLMLGIAYYYKQDPFEALNNLNYMNSVLVKNRKKNYAKIYTALAQAQSGNSFEANELFMKMAKSKMKKRDKKLFTKSFAQFLIDEKNYDNAIKMLVMAKRYNKGKYNHGRYNFIQAQLYEAIGKEREALVYYQMAFRKKPDPELEVKSQIAISRLYKGDSKLAYLNRIEYLKKLTKEGLYKSKTNELYYAMSILALKAKSEDNAMKYLNQSLKEKESDPQVRGLVYQQIGDIYFSKPDYLYANAYYDSAVVKLTDPTIKSNLENKNNSLKDLAKKYYLIQRNDSILSIANMQPEARNTFFQKHITKLKEEEEKERVRIERLMQTENTTEFSTEVILNNPSQNYAASSGKGGKWYFYNTNIKQTGALDFKQIWGDRTLADNWRMNKTVSGIDELKNQMLGKESEKNPQRFEISYYLNKIPAKPVLNDLKQERDTVEFSLGILYYEKLKDLKSANNTLEHLISTPPHDEELTQMAMYNLYRFNKEQNPDLSKRYADLVTRNYPNSKYAESILNPDINVFSSKSSKAIAFYEETYKKYEEGNYEEVKERASQALEQFPTDEIIAKFSLLSVFSDGKMGNKEEFMSGLERVSLAFQNKEEGKKAKQLLEYFKVQGIQSSANQPNTPAVGNIQSSQPNPKPVPPPKPENNALQPPANNTPPQNTNEAEKPAERSWGEPGIPEGY